MIKFLSMSVFRLSVLYVVLVLLSFVTSLLLPSFHDVALMRTESCYWTNAMLPFVKCGQDVIAGSVKSFFFNFWLWFIYFPMFLLWQTILVYAPIVVILSRLISIFRCRSANAS
jgi:hypothetical protein